MSNLHAKGAPNIILSCLSFVAVSPCLQGFLSSVSTRSYSFLLWRTLIRPHWPPAQANGGSLPVITPGSNKEIWKGHLGKREEGRTTVRYSTRGSKAVTPGPAVLSLLVLCFFLLWD